MSVHMSSKASNISQDCRHKPSQKHKLLAGAQTKAYASIGTRPTSAGSALRAAATAIAEVASLAVSVMPIIAADSVLRDADIIAALLTSRAYAAYGSAGWSRGDCAGKADNVNVRRRRCGCCGGGAAWGGDGGAAGVAVRTGVIVVVVAVFAATVIVTAVAAIVVPTVPPAATTAVVVTTVVTTSAVAIIIAAIIVTAAAIAVITSISHTLSRTVTRLARRTPDPGRTACCP